MRTVIIGDIHGCYTEFVQLLEKVRFDRNHDRLILLGDLIDRGPFSYEVLALVKYLKDTMNDRLVILRGSHEYMLLRNSRRISDRLLWRVVGKGASLRSFHKNGASLYDCVPWIRENTVLFYEDELFQCAHAGISREPIEVNDEHALLLNHHLVQKNAYTGKLTITGHIHLKQPSYFEGHGGKETILAYHKRLKLPQTGVLCIGTGCAEGGKLTALVNTDDEYELACVPRQRSARRFYE